MQITHFATSLPNATFVFGDHNPGSAEYPFATLAGVRAAVCASGLLGREPIQVILRAGVYYLPETLVFTAADSGAAAAPVEYRSAAGKTAVISGGSEIGVSLLEVPADSAAAKAKLEVGDVILKCADQPTDSVADLQRRWNRVTSGKVRLEVWRGQKAVAVEVMNDLP